MEFVRFVLKAVALAIVLGLLVALAVPGGDRILDAATAVSAAATWIVPLSVLARWHIRPPRTSLGSVGMSISLIASTLTLSLITIVLAILDFIFARGGEWAWRSLGVVGAFWLVGPLALYGSSRFEKPMKRSVPPTP